MRETNITMAMGWDETSWRIAYDGCHKFVSRHLVQVRGPSRRCLETPFVLYW
jgi:hypothetical protein